jgi:hypothetical protein
MGKETTITTRRDHEGIIKAGRRPGNNINEERWNGREERRGNQ